MNVWILVKFAVVLFLYCGTQGATQQGFTMEKDPIWVYFGTRLGTSDGLGKLQNLD